MNTYLSLMANILDKGFDSDDRTGTGTRSLFGSQMVFDLSEGFPAVTTKKLAWKSVLSEMLWFIKGSSNTNDLRAILHGEEHRNNKEKKTIWDANAENQGKALGYSDGELGPVYGYQWRNWRQYEINNLSGSTKSVSLNGKVTTVYNTTVKIKKVDQLASIIETIKTNPTCRRLILSAWNVAEISDMALPPCHCFCQFRILDGKLHCHLYMRSNDMFLGAPFDIAGYALLTHMIAHVTSYPVGELVYTIGDAHIYNNHFEQVEKQLSRKPFQLPKLQINKDTTNINDFTMEDFELVDYKHHSSIKAPMAI